MNRLIASLVLGLLCSHATAYHSEAGDSNYEPLNNASCNASFMGGCIEETADHHDETTDTFSSSSVAAPTGVLGNSSMESALLAMLIAAPAFRRFRSRSRQQGSDGK